MDVQADAEGAGVPGPDGGPGLITTMYIDAAEYAALSQLPAAILRKAGPSGGTDRAGPPLRRDHQARCL
jgi:hypothetical protein